MKGFLYGFSFFITNWLFDISTTGIASKPISILLYSCLPILIYLTSRNMMSRKKKFTNRIAKFAKKGENNER